MNDYVLRLFVTGRSASAATAIRNLERICREDLANRYRIEVIDVVEDPGEASAFEVFATPTLVKSLPPPLRRIIGDLSEHDEVLVGLDVTPVPDGARADD
ncbi:circadian clock KaiB family protein [Thiococcus pfennigii]|uniref:circadian clock KaiB family protein n=1 Tax=Thiococcus pfennigii TaxID=1057 RepID=UPI001A91B5D8|nr:circadian clock KaiB family protein [Thiococcus pfennigii]